MLQASERTQIAQEVLDTHAEKLRSKFSTEELQDLFIDVFGKDIGSSKDLAGLQNQFANGTLRPEVKFVSPEILTDAYGNLRDAAFDREHQTILLSKDLDVAGIESSIQQEIGHWWDVQLNGNQDTVTENEKPFDEGAAYAERFSEGAKGDNIFSDVVYQNDFHTVFVNGQATEVEFRPIATWNIQGNTRTPSPGQELNTLQDVLNLMENPGLGTGRALGPIEVMALQEVDANTLTNTLRTISGINTIVENEALDAQDPNRGNAPVNLREITFNRGGNQYLMFYNNNSGVGIGNAIILRNPPPREQITPYAFANIRGRQNERGYLAVETPAGIYFSIHAEAQLGAGLNTGNDAELLIREALTRDLGSERPRFVLGDFNRNIAFGNNPNAAFRLAFPPELANILRRPDARTIGTRGPEATGTLDYMFTRANLLNSNGEVLNRLPDVRTDLFPSDHFPVLYDDEIRSLEGGNGTVNVQRTFGGTTVLTPNPPNTPNVPIDENVEFTSSEMDIDFSGDGRGGRNQIGFTISNPNSRSTFFGEGQLNFNGYVFQFEDLAPIESVAIDEFTNTTGVPANQIKIDYDPDTIRVNLLGTSFSYNTRLELVVNFAESFPNANA